MQYLKCVVLFLGIHIATVTSKHVKFYRKDYTYIFDYDAFYKLHVVNNTSWETAFLTCENEDAKLFYPSEGDEWKIVEKLRAGMEVAANVTDVLIGVHNQFNLGEFLTVDGHSPPLSLGNDLQHVEVGEACVTMDSELGSYEKGPCTRIYPTLFVCKKLDNQPCPTTTCPTIDPGYKYCPQSNKCYKVNKNTKPWQEAIQTCYLEGGLLATVEDSTRVNNIRGVLNLYNDYTTYFIGVRDLFNNGKYYTVEGKNIGVIQPRADQVPQYTRTRNWVPGDVAVDPDEYGIEQGESETPLVTLQAPFGCGVLTSDKIEAASCYDEMPFICEMETSKQSN